MRTLSFAFAVLLCLPTQAVSLKRAGVPKAVIKSAADAYEISREEWDSFGIFEIEVFNMQKGAALKEALQQLIVQTASEDPSLLGVCQKELGNDINYDLCVSYLLKTQGQEKRLGVPLKELFGDAYEYYGQGSLTSLKTTSQKRYSLLISDVIDYVKGMMPSDHHYYFFRAQRRELGVNVETLILVGVETPKVLLLRRDSGC